MSQIGQKLLKCQRCGLRLKKHVGRLVGRGRKQYLGTECPSRNNKKTFFYVPLNDKIILLVNKSQFGKFFWHLRLFSFCRLNLQNIYAYQLYWFGLWLPSVYFGPLSHTQVAPQIGLLIHFLTVQQFWIHYMTFNAKKAEQHSFKEKLLICFKSKLFFSPQLIRSVVCQLSVPHMGPTHIVVIAGIPITRSNWCS